MSTLIPYSVSVVVPIYNEVGLTKHAVSGINAFLQQYFTDYEIVIIESGSTDGSGRVCDELAHAERRIRVIHEGARNGFGSALTLGCKRATKDLVWLVTVDLPFPLESVLRALPLLDRYECVLSYRVNDRRPVARRIQSVIYNTMVKLALGIRVRHVNSAFKLFKRHVVQALDLRSKGWFVDAEILYEIECRKTPYVEIPVELVDRVAGRSSVGPLSAASVMKELARFVVETRARRWRERAKCADRDRAKSRD